MNVTTWLVWVVALGILALPVGNVGLALTSAAVFGASYMALTGVFAGAAFVGLAAAYQVHPRIRLREAPGDTPREFVNPGGRRHVPEA